MALPAYDQCIKASHVFNLLDARGVISVTERQSYILRVRELAKGLRRGLAGDRRGRGLVTQARILRQAPILFASNLRDTYWRDKLGFEQHGILGEPLEFVHHAIRQCRRDAQAGRRRARDHSLWKISEGIWNAYFWVDDIEALFADLKRRGATIDRTVRSIL